MDDAKGAPGPGSSVSSLTFELRHACRELGPVANAGLAEHVRDVPLDGLPRQEQPRGDLGCSHLPRSGTRSPARGWSARHHRSPRRQVRTPRARNRLPASSRTVTARAGPAACATRVRTCLARSRSLCARAAPRSRPVHSASRPKSSSSASRAAASRSPAADRGFWGRRTRPGDLVVRRRFAPPQNGVRLSGEGVRAGARLLRMTPIRGSRSSAVSPASCGQKTRWHTAERCCTPSDPREPRPESSRLLVGAGARARSGRVVAE